MDPSETPVPKSMPDVLIVEDEPAIRELVAFVCENEGFRAVRADCVAAAQTALEAERPDVILLDWMLPDRSGLEWLRDVRTDERFKDVPVIMLTARGAEADRVRGLDTGADDYIVKPFLPRELAARIRAQLRRRPGSAAVSGEKAPSADERIIACGPVRIDESKFEVTVEGVPVRLSVKEFRLLKIFASKPGRVFSRAQLLDAVWQQAFVDERTVDVHMLRLRKVLAGTAAEDFIETVRGVGYRAKTYGD